LVLSAAGPLGQPRVARGHFQGPPESLEKLTDEADIIFKGTTVSSGPAKDDWFKPYRDWDVRGTQFKVISVVKGEKPDGKLTFLHYDQNPQSPGFTFMPQYYHFEPGRTYLVFAKKGAQPGVFRQLWQTSRTKEDQGVVRCADDKPVIKKSVKEIVWAELMAMLKSKNPNDVVYAVGQLDQMSGGRAGFDSLSDFNRTDVLAAVRGLIANRDTKIAAACIDLVGSHNPYLSDERTLFWLASVGNGEFPGLVKMDPKMKNAGGELCWKDLVAVADSNAPSETRSKAIRALGLVREPSLNEHIERWLVDSQPAVRASSAVLLADFPSEESRKHLTAMAGDPSPEVRASVAHAIGFSRQAEMADVLFRLLADKGFEVRQAAAMSLLSFSPKNDRFAAIFRTNLGNEEFKPLFLIALARQQPADYLDALAKAVKENANPRQFWGGEIPAFTCWHILFHYLQSCPADDLSSGKLDRYLNAMEKVGNYSSSEPCYIYAFYLQRGMNERAKSFREAAKKAASYDLDYYLNRVDANPSQFNPE
jgi:hypothetical protein